MIFVSGVHHGADIVLDQAVVAGLKGADINDHIDLLCPVKYRTPCLVGLHIRESRPQRKTDDGAYRYI